VPSAPEAAGVQAQVIEIADATRHPYSIGMAYFGGGTLHVLRGEWRKARSLIEHGLEASRTAKALMQVPPPTAECAWILAQLGERSASLVRSRG
jgi:hypothetical protein